MALVKADLDVVFGSDNINMWSDLNNNGLPVDIATRVAWAIVLATAQVKAKFKPLTYDWTDVSEDPLVSHAIVLKAGLLLHANRRVTDETGASHNPMKAYMEEYDQFLKDLAGGRLALEGTRTNRPYPAVGVYE